MNSRLRENLRTAFVVSAGWLFADLLLALAMLFLTANTVAIRPPPTPTPTPPPTKTVLVHPPPKPVDLLDKRTLIVLNVDYTTLLSSNPPPQVAVNTLALQIQSEVIREGLQNRRSGLALAYGVAADTSQLQLDQADAMSSVVYQALDILRKQSFLFFHDSLPYERLFTTDHAQQGCNDLSCVKIVVFLFTK